MQSRKPGARPAEPLQLYDIAACPFCRRVRETLSSLELDVQILPCRRGGARFRPRAVALGGKAQFPFLVDPNKGVKMYESADIVEYLTRSYGDGVPSEVRGVSSAVRVATGVVAGIRRRRAARAVSAAAPVPAGRGPDPMLELYGYERSDECAAVREVLCQMEIPYLLHNVVEGSDRWQALAERTGAEGVPVLIDAGAGAARRGAAEIVDHLESVYGLL